jgi:Fuc2NAc and GlcNAc transferase
VAAEGLVVIAVLATAAVGTEGLRRYALARGVLDIPNPRSSHTVATPRGGGVAIVLAFLGGLTALLALGHTPAPLYAALTLGGGLVALVGFWDDHAPLSPMTRALLHGVAAVWALYCLGGWPRLDLGVAGLDWGLPGAAVGVLALAWLLNLYNFMDGIDGIAATEAVLVAAGGCLLLGPPGAGPWWELAILAASALGFARLNWPPARIFMGDAGSGFLGYALGVLALGAITSGATAPWPWLILLGVFLVDATVTLLRRIMRGERWYQAHRSHAYQWAARRYGAHRPVTLAVAAIDLAWLLPLSLAADRWKTWALPLTAVALLPLAVLALWLGAGRPEATEPAGVGERPPVPPP